MILKFRWHFVALSILLPLLIPLLAGGYWLWQRQLLIWWIAASAFVALTWWGIREMLKKYRPEPKWLDITQSMIQTPQSDMAWKKVEAISIQERNTNPDLGSSTFYLKTLTRVMNDVATVYYPQQKQAALEIKIPYLLKVIEIFAQELRINFTENVPGSHVFSLNDLAKGHKIASKGREVYRLFRIVTAGMDPVSAVIREVRIFANNSLLTNSTEEIKRWLIDAYIKKVGYYAIELYSGNLTLDDEVFNKPTRETQREIDKIREREKTQSAEPFRVMVIGQANVGKASLINAIAQRQLAIVDATPNSIKPQSYLLHHEDFPSTLIVESQSYQDMQPTKERQSLLKQASKSDVVIFVLAATNAAYQLDKCILDSLKQLDNGPRLIFALTQIDKLRPFREWNPPYNLLQPCSPKAEAIQHARTIVAEQLRMDVHQIVPLCLRPEQTYNCQEQLTPLILQQFKLAESRRYARSLKSYRRESSRNRFWLQFTNAGHWLSKAGIYLLRQKLSA